jgi:hypothetical protein
MVKMTITETKYKVRCISFALPQKFYIHLPNMYTPGRVTWANLKWRTAYTVQQKVFKY